MPIIGIIDSSKTQWVSGDYEWISSYVVPNATTTSFALGNIPATYKHLQLRGSTRVIRPGQYGGELFFGFNTDTTNTNYNNHEVSVSPPSGASANASWNVSGYAGFYAIRNTGSSAQAGNFAPFILDILDYANTNKKKQMRLLTGWDVNRTDAGYSALNGGLWNSTAAINRIAFGLAYGDYISQGSVFNLYGIKG